MVKVRIFVEGGRGSRAADAPLREGFQRFFSKMDPACIKPTLVVETAKDGPATLEKFRMALAEGRDEFLILLVDSEEAVAAGRSPWQHLRLRGDSKLQRPSGATDDQAHLMVQCMEAWFLADPDALEAHFGRGFLRNSLPSSHDVEPVEKTRVLDALDHATKRTSKGPYKKLRDDGAMLARIGPEKVCKASRHAESLCKCVVARVTGRQAPESSGGPSS